MSAYAILGATGNTGLSLLQLLGASPNNTIHVLVRSRAKLENLYPSLSSNSNIKVFESSISDTDTLSNCLANTKAVFLTVAVTENIPGCTISQDTAHAIVSALQKLKAEEQAFKPPRLIILSSASCDDKFWIGVPSLVHSFMWAANANIYTDLVKAEAYLREQEDWLSSTFVMPGGLTHDVQKGHELSTREQQTFISFLDLAAGMIEVADAESGKWDMAHVSVVLKGGQKGRFEWRAPPVLMKGFLCYWFPWLYRYLP
ncbi:Nn.00g013890.m01.CDS01 [Neocucurbitaria sp. VM-36]